ncbi:MAG: fatty acid oxidation complex subunit alpha FadJ [Nevskia sp.]|nr:fatty acid oxidation complex subunit alpha FadJ [Nevskia sp.]
MAKTSNARKTATVDAATSAFTFTVRDDGIGVVEIDVPGDAQNTLKREFGEQFDAVLDEARAHARLKGLVIRSAKAGSFVAGADIGLFDRAQSAAEVEELSHRCQQAFRQLEEFPVPVVAAIDGACLGGGLELALACHGRVCTNAKPTVLGLPEVMLGLLPAAGGTQRLPRLIGIARSLDLLLTGKQLRPAQALKLGVVDEVVAPGVLLEAAVRRIADMVATHGRGTRLQERLQHARGGVQPARDEALGLVLEDNPFGRRVLFQQARKQTRGKTRGNYPAPERIIEVVETGFAKGIEAGYAAEAKAFGELAMTGVSRQCRNIFFAQNALKKETFVGGKNVKPRSIERVAVLGAGLMGSGIALVTANKAGLPVRLKDRDDKGLAGGYAYLRKFYGKRVQRRAMSRAEAEAELSRVTGGADYSGFAHCDLVVEAVFEDLKLKHRMLHDVESHCRADTIFASNTSSIPIADIAKAAKRPENVIGLHYFSPVEKMPLLEIIATPQTAPEVIAACAAFGKAQGKTVIVVRDGPGFYTTRILAPYLNEATRILAEGVDPHAVDDALMDFGYPVGPITLLDEVGIDVGTKVAPVLAAAFGERMTPPQASAAMIEAGFLGRKAGKGFYLYDAAKKGGKPVNAGLHRLLGVKLGRKMEAAEIAGRCAWMMINEAAHCMQDGILFEPMHGDVGAIFGLGFPPFRGGPFRYVDSIGAAAAVEQLEQLAAVHGPRFAPAPILREMARDGSRFYP